MEMQQNGLSCQQFRIGGVQESTRLSPGYNNRQSDCGRDSEVNIGGNGKQSIDYKAMNSKMLSPLAFHHKLQNRAVATPQIE